MVISLKLIIKKLNRQDCIYFDRRCFLKPSGTQKNQEKCKILMVGIEPPTIM